MSASSRGETASEWRNSHTYVDGRLILGKTYAPSISMASVSYRRPPVGYADRTDQDLHVYVSRVFGAVISFQKAQLVDLTNDGQVSATDSFHSFATSAQLHHFPSTRLRPSRSCRVWLGHYGKPY
jgi:hypothetical protein